MVGAGIFLFPGIAGGRAGLAATLSFALGAGVALTVALPMSELATAMPRSGGGYNFVSKAMGGMVGSVVGMSLWLGLVFASAFYLAGFGHYTVALLGDIGVSLGSPPVIAVLAGLILVIVAITGTEKTGRLQDSVLVILITILLFFLADGVLESLGVIGEVRTPVEFAPNGLGPILPVTALVFTSYLGFAQIANVGGEVQDPERNLPRAMIASVVIVGILYVSTLYVTTSFFSADRLSELGETALVEVARVLLGSAGAVVISLAGLLATLSSANASILGSSRMIFALGRDGLIPKRIGEVNERFRTPHISILLAGLPVVILALIGKITVLAQAASFLHLILYGLVAFSVVVLRHRDTDWYSPRFLTPGYPLLPIIGGFSSFAVILFMEPVAIAIGIATMLASVAWYFSYERIKQGGMENEE